MFVDRIGSLTYVAEDVIENSDSVMGTVNLDRGCKRSTRQAVRNYYSTIQRTSVENVNINIHRSIPPSSLSCGIDPDGRRVWWDSGLGSGSA